MIQFRCQGKTIAHTELHGTFHLPRMGEYLWFPGSKDNNRYRVSNVTHFLKTDKDQVLESQTIVNLVKSDELNEWGETNG